LREREREREREIFFSLHVSYSLPTLYRLDPFLAMCLNKIFMFNQSFDLAFDCTSYLVLDCVGDFPLWSAFPLKFRLTLGFFGAQWILPFVGVGVIYHRNLLPCAGSFFLHVP